MDIVEFIPKGKDNAIHLQELVKILHCSDTYIKCEIRKARNAGAPIVSGCAGYWLTDSNEESEQFILSMRKQAITRLNSIKRLNKAVQIDGQISLFGDGLARETGGEQAETI